MELPEDLNAVPVPAESPPFQADLEGLRGEAREGTLIRSGKVGSLNDDSRGGVQTWGLPVTPVTFLFYDCRDGCGQLDSGKTPVLDLDWLGGAGIYAYIIPGETDE